MLSVRKLALTTTGVAYITLGNLLPATAASMYSIAELPFQPADINDQGQIVGEQYLWANGSVTDLRTLPGAGTSPIFATAINNQGAIVGGGLTVGSFNSQAFKSDGTSVTALPLLPFCTTNCSPTTARGINDADTVALLFDNRTAYVQQSDGTATQAFASGSVGVMVGAINNNGAVVGSTPATSRSGPGEGVVYDSTNNTRTVLRGSGYCNSGGCFSPSTVARDINEQGQVVGSGPVGEPSRTSPVHALLWNNLQSDRVGTDLGTLGGNSSQANGLNNLGQIVGQSQTSSGTQHAFLWENANLIDLNSSIEENFGWELTSATEINNQGQIIGTGVLNGQQRGFVLTPVPESSSTVGIFGFGVLGFGAWLQRQLYQKSANK